MPYKLAYNADLLEHICLKIWMFGFCVPQIVNFFFVFLVCFELYIDVLSASMGFCVIFCIYEHIKKKVFFIFEVSKLQKPDFVIFSSD